MVSLAQPLAPQIVGRLVFSGPVASAVHFRYLFVTDARGFHVVDITVPEQARPVPGASIALTAAERVFVARTYAYVAYGAEGLAIIDITRAEQPRLVQHYDGEGSLRDVRDVVIASTNASAFAYLPNGAGGLAVLQLTAPDTQPKFYGFSPPPQPALIATYPTKTPALALSRGLERDRAVDESGHQIAVFRRLGSRPFTLSEMRELYLDRDTRQGLVGQRRHRPDAVHANANVGCVDSG